MVVTLLFKPMMLALKLVRSEGLLSDVEIFLFIAVKIDGGLPMYTDFPVWK